MAAVGVIGLGSMGMPMAESLRRAGHEVAGFDVAGKGDCGSVEEVVQRAERAVIVLVRTTPQVLSVVHEIDPERPLDVIVMSTVSPAAMSRVDALCEARGLTALDAPVSGGVAGAEAATLTVMVSGNPEAIERSRPLFDVLGQRTFVIGEHAGQAQAVKLANQLMLAVCMFAAQEGVKLAEQYGVRPDQVLPVIASSTGASWAAANWDVVLGWWRDYQPGGALDIISKDLRTLLVDAAERELPLPTAALAFNRLHEVWK